MVAMAPTNDLGGWTNDESTPLGRAMADLTLQVVQRIVVRSPIGVILHETINHGDSGPVHEVTARTGFLLRSPIRLLRVRRPPPPDRSAEPPRRA